MTDTILIVAAAVLAILTLVGVPSKVNLNAVAILCLVAALLI